MNVLNAKYHDPASIREKIRRKRALKPRKKPKKPKKPKEEWRELVSKDILCPFQPEPWGSKTKWSLKLLHVLACLHRTLAEQMERSMEEEPVIPFDEFDEEIPVGVDVDDVIPYAVDEPYDKRIHGHELWRIAGVVCAFDPMNTVCEEDYYRLDSAAKIAERCSMGRTGVSRMLARAAREGLVVRMGRDKLSRAIVWKITEKGLQALWTGINKRISRRSIMGDNQRYVRPNDDPYFKFDALHIMEDVIEIRNMAKAGTANPEFDYPAREYKHPKTGKVYTVARERLIIKRPATIYPRYYTGQVYQADYCWKPSLIWELLRSVPLHYIKHVFRLAEDRDKEGSIKNFFAFTYGVLLGGRKEELMTGERTNRKPRRLDKREKEFRRVAALTEYVAYGHEGESLTYAKSREILKTHKKAGTAIKAAFTTAYDSLQFRETPELRFRATPCKGLVLQ